MRCCSCYRNIAAGAEAQKMIVEYEQRDGSVQVCGYMMPDGPLSAATGAMLRGWHSKCYWVAKKREARGDQVTGRVVAGSPTGYDINELVLTRDDLAALGITPAEARERSTVQLSHRLHRLRELAQSIGKGVGDAHVQEAFAADEHGGPYAHQHHHRLDGYQLLAHLEYAHGVTDAKSHGIAALQDQHSRLHVAARQVELINSRVEDGSCNWSRDWREQFTAELERKEDAE